MTPVFPFGEGRTDRVVFDFLRRNLGHDPGFREFVPVGGKNNFRSTIEQVVQSEIIPDRDIGVLVFRDLDADESPEDVAQAFRDIAWELLSDWNLQPSIDAHPHYPNIYICIQPSSTSMPGLRLVLHVADNDALDLPVALPNHTTDGYVLAAGLADAVLERFAGKVDSDAPTLYELITNTIPNTVAQANITFAEDKDYLSAYLCSTRFWVVHRTEAQMRLVRIILDRARKYDQASIDHVFDTWRAAIEEALQ